MKNTSSPPPAEDGQFQAGRVLTISAGHAIHDTYTAFLAPLLPKFISNLSLSKTEAGLLTVFMQAPSLSQPFIGHLADRVSLRYFVILAPLVTATIMSLLGIAPSYSVLAMFLLVVGASSASMHAVGPVMAGRLSGRNLGRGMGFWMVGGELGRTLGPLLIVTTVRLLTLKGTPWLMLGGFLASAILYARLKDVPGRPLDDGPGIPWRRALRAMRPLLIPLTGIIVARSFMNAALTTFLPTFLSEEGADFWIAGASLSILEAAGVAGALLGGSISDRLGRRSVLFASMLTTPLLMFTFLTVGGWGQFPLLLLLGFSSLAVSPVVMALVQESFPENRALANGVYMAISFILRSVVVVALGGLGDLLGLRLAFTISGGITLLGLPLIFLLPERRR
ncbi:MAG: MFS transporter [Chloroflexota bacterium]|nr:MFS transporter [Chloroflexota bacterium]